MTCNEPLPLRLLIRKLNSSADTLFMTTLQVELIGYTNIRAHDLLRTESASWIIASRSNMKIPIGRSEDPPETDWLVDNGLWAHVPLPNTVAPSFDTCNLSRRYELEVRIGLSAGSVDGNLHPELIVSPLRLKLLVYSGITPPPALLAKMGASPPLQTNNKPNSKPSAAPAYSPASAPNVGPATGGGGAGGIPDDAPPSYEDAIAEDLAPIDGPRRRYDEPNAVPSNGEEFGGGGVRRGKGSFFGAPPRYD